MLKNRIGSACVLMAVTLSALHASAKETAWQGGGGVWSDATHWANGVPVSGDTVYLSAETEGDVITNDIAGLKLGTLGGTGDKRVILTGESLELSNMNLLLFDCPLTVTNMPTLTLHREASAWVGVVNLKGGDSHFYTDLILETTSVPISFGTGDKSKNIYYHGKVGDGNGRFVGGSGGHYFYGTVALESCSRNLNDSYFFFYRGTQPDSFSSFYVGYFGSVHFCEAQAMATNTVLEWKDYQQQSGGLPSWEMSTAASEPSSGAYRFYCSLWADQTIDRISQPIPIEGTAPNRKYLARIVTKSEGWWGYEYAPTLTLRGTAAATAYVELMHSLSLVWDPVDDYTQTFAGCTNSMKGTITVKGGTLKLAEGEAFANVPALTISGGTLELDASGEKMFPSVTTLTVSGTGALKLTDQVTTDPFASGKVDAVLSGQGHFELASGTAVSLKTLVARGVLTANGTFTGTGYGTTGVEEVPWIVGAGRVTVTANATTENHWKTFGAGTWSDPANWTRGHVPTADDTVVVAAEGTYALTLDGASPVPKRLTVGGTDANVTLSLAGDHGVSNAWLEVKSGSTVDVPAGASFFYDGYGSAGRTVDALGGSPIKVAGGGALTVSGGELIITNMTGLVEIGDDSAPEAKLALTAGTFGFFPYAVQDTVRTHANGLVDFSGGTVRGRPTVYVSTPDMKDGARLRIRGTATLTPEIKGNNGTLFAVGDTSMIYANVTDYAQSSTDRFDGNTGIVRVELSTQFLDFSNPNPPNETFFGLNSGSAYVTLSNLFYQAGAVGMDIGSYRTYWRHSMPKSDLAPFVTGVVDVVDAAIEINGQSSCKSGWGSSHLAGLKVGYGGEPSSTCHAERSFVGDLTLREGGFVTNLYGDTSIGVGYGVGTMTVAGGSLVLCPEDSTQFKASERTFALGVFGGDGTCVVTNGGTIASSCDLYVGGAALERYPFQQKVGSVGCPTNRHNAVGAFRVCDGTVALGRDLVLGADGSGEVTVVGKSAAFSVGRDLVFSNTVENAASGGTLAFVLATNGVSSVAVAGKVTIGPAARLVIDARDYDVSARRRRVRLLTAAGGVSGAFAETEILLADDVPGYVTVGGTAIDAFIGKPQGMVINVR